MTYKNIKRDLRAIYTNVHSAVFSIRLITNTLVWSLTSLNKDTNDSKNISVVRPMEHRN